MRARAVAVALLVAAVPAAGCGGGPKIDQPRRVAAFDRLRVSGGIDVAIVRGARRAVTVRAGRAVIDRVVTATDGDTLRVGVRDRGIVIGPDPLSDVHVRVTAPKLRSVEVDGAGGVDLGDVRTGELRVDVGGAGDVRGSGRVGTLTATVHGAGDLALADVRARTAHIEIHGAAGVDVSVSRELDVEIHGAGDVRYRGHPRVHSEIHGAGDVSRVTP